MGKKDHGPDVSLHGFVPKRAMLYMGIIESTAPLRVALVSQVATLHRASSGYLQ